MESLLAEKYATYATGLTGVRGFIAADSHLWLPDESLHSTDRATMAHGIEYRVPFLDQLVLSHAAAIPLYKNLSPRLGKKVLRNVYANVLPSHLFVRRKRGWLSPAAKWFRDEKINNLINQIMSAEYSDKLSDVIDWGQAKALLSEHVAGTTYAVNPLWNLIQLQVWVKSQKLNF
jgi:asparagine synthase (glutamine-hydrolysing)